MKCPYCQKEMQPGYLHNWKQPVHWIPEGERPSAFAFMIAEQGVPLLPLAKQGKPLAWMKGYRAAAYHCPDCGILLAPTKK